MNRPLYRAQRSPQFAFLNIPRSVTSELRRNVNDLRAIRKQVSGTADEALPAKVSHRERMGVRIVVACTYSSDQE